MQAPSLTTKHQGTKRATQNNGANICYVNHHRFANKCQRVRPRVSAKDVADIISYDAYIITKGALLFGTFWGALNWMHYRNLVHEDKKEKGSKNKK